MKITLKNLEVVECFPKGAAEGHLHMTIHGGKLSRDDGKEVGEFAVDYGMSLVFKVGKQSYHIDGKKFSEMVLNAIELDQKLVK